MLSTGFSTNCAPNFFQNSDNLITFGNMSTENKGLNCIVAYNNIISRFPNHIFYINFVLIDHIGFDFIIMHYGIGWGKTKNIPTKFPIARDF